MLTKADIEKYFLAEKQAGLFFMMLGIVAILLAIAFYFYWKTSFFKGIAIPFLLFGLIQAVVGYTVRARSDKQRIDNVYSFDMNPGQLQNNELPRMQKVVKNFVIYRWVEIALFFAGIIIVYLYRNNEDKTFLYGVGLALAIQAIIMFSADFFAEKRAKIYTDQLSAWLNSKK